MFLLPSPPRVYTVYTHVPTLITPESIHSEYTHMFLHPSPPRVYTVCIHKITDRPVISKLFKKAFNLQLSVHFENKFNPFLGAFRPGMGCRSTLLRLVEGWRKALDNHEYVTTILMDLSKASDCLPHDLLLGKLRAYGLSDKACALVSSYLSNRKQWVKLGPQYGDWA